MWTHVSATPIFDDEHHFNGSFAMFTDITERKRAEEALREMTEELVQLVLHNMPDVRVVHRPHTDGYFSRLQPSQWPSNARIEFRLRISSV